MIFKNGVCSFDEKELDYYVKKYNINKDILKILLSRGIDTVEKLDKYIYTENYAFYDPFLLNNMKEVVEKIKYYIANDKKILIYGDYDVDGVSASAILIKYLKSINVKVSSFLPNRYEDGYGITNSAIDKIIKNDKPDLIITVDCGISCYKEIEYIKSKNIDIIVTDHHEIPEILPNCLIINPKIPGQKYPFRELCGTGVAFKLLQALAGEDVAEDYVAICAIATIADIVPLLDENRLIVKKGLKNLDSLPIGIKMLIKELKMSLPISSTDIAFKLSPKINASGRMGDANKSLQLYLIEDTIKLKQIIQIIMQYNFDRQQLCNKVYDDCKAKLENLDVASLGVIILKSDDWDSGILGIVCAKLVDEYNKPVILFAKEGECYKGSARSIGTINIHEVLSNNKDIISSFGGHSMAAGIELKLNYYTEFLYRINNYVLQNIDKNLLLPVKFYDLEINDENLNINYIKQFEIMEPFGCENSRPIFLFNFNKCNVSCMKNFKNHLNIKVNKNNIVAFNSINNYDILCSECDKEALIDVYIDNYNKKEILKINLKYLKLKHLNVNNEIVEKNIFYLSQLNYINDDIKAVYNYYEKENLYQLIQKLKINENNFGTLFVIFNKENLNLLESLNINIHSKYLYKINESYGLNSVILSPVSCENFNYYKRIIFLEPILIKNYLGYIQSLGDIELFIPNNSLFDKNIFLQINSTRQNMLSIYNNIIKIKDINYNSIINFLIKYRNNLKNSLLNIYFALIVFKELGIINVSYEDFSYNLKINQEIKTNLKNSKIYNYVNFIKSTI